MAVGDKFVMPEELNTDPMQNAKDEQRATDTQIRQRQIAIDSLNAPNLSDVEWMNRYSEYQTAYGLPSVEKFLNGRSADDILTGQYNLSDTDKNNAIDSIMQSIQGSMLSGVGQQEKVLQQSIGQMAAKEKWLKGQLGETRTAMEGAIDKQLASLLEDTGFQADKARSMVGETFAARGLGRSTGQVSKVQDATLMEFEQRAEQRRQAESQKGQVKAYEQGVLDKIDQAKQQMAQAQQLGNIQQAKDLVFNMDVDALKEQFQRDTLEMELDAANSAFMGDFVSTMIGAVVGVGVGVLTANPYLGYAAGTAAGAGSKAVGIGG